MMVRMVVIDVDGTLTDGTVYIGNEGELCKGFYVRDGIGIINIIKAGIVPVILTSRESRIVNERCKELGITEIYQGVEDKREKMLEIMKKNSISKEEIAYIADDVNDLESIALASLRGCPNDAVFEIKNICNFISRYDGGRGAVREFCEYILNKNNNLFIQ